MSDGCDDGNNVSGWGVVIGITIVLLLITVGLVWVWIQVDE